jgi:hypothetical protein
MVRMEFVALPNWTRALPLRALSAASILNQSQLRSYIKSNRKT